MSESLDTSNYELGKPPIVETWIRASFMPSEGSEAWDWQQVLKFLNTFDTNLDVVEGLPEPPRILKVRKSKTKDTLTVNVEAEQPEARYFRARNTDTSQIVQIGKTELLVSLMRDNSTNYAGFAKLMDFFALALEKLEETVGTRTIHLLELHYVDLIQIPMKDGAVDLRQFFCSVPEVNGDPFGKMWQVNWSVNWNPPNSTDSSQLAVQALSPEADTLRFRLDWHRSCENIPSRDYVFPLLKEANIYLKQCFRAFCLPALWALFDPREKDA